MLVVVLTITGAMAQKVTKDGSWSFCDYDNALIAFSSDDVRNLTRLEISWDNYDKTYGIFIEYKGDKSNLSVVYKPLPNDGGSTGYLYTGTDRISNAKVSVITKRKLSEYVNGKGLSRKDLNITKDGIMVIYIKNKHTISIAPLLKEK